MNTRIAAGLTETGDIRIVGVACPGTSRVWVKLIRSQDDFIGQDDPVLWAIESLAPRETVDVVVGSTQSGFTEVVPLEGGLRASPSLVVEISWGDSSQSMRLDLGEGGTDAVTDSDGTVTESTEFIDERRNTFCD